MKKNEAIANLRNRINNLYKLAYPLNTNGIESPFNELSDISIHIKNNEKTDNSTSFKWNYKKEIRCEFLSSPDLTSITVAYNHDKHLEVVNYFRQKNCEMLYYYPTGWENRICLNLADNKIRKGEAEENATEYDYEMFNNILVDFSKKVLDCLSHLEEQKTYSKKKKKK